MYLTRRSRWFGLLFLLPFLICFVLFWLLPLVYGIWMSLHDFRLSFGENGFVGLSNYRDLLFNETVHQRLFLATLTNTLWFMLYSVPLLVICSLLLALLIRHLPRRFKTFFRTIFFMSYSISVTAVSAIYLWLFATNGGFINRLLLDLHFINSPVNWTSDQPFAWVVIVIATVWWTVGFNMLLFLNALEEVDNTLYEAASLDGASPWQQFLRITLPTIRPITFFVLITTLIASFNLYGQTLLITRGGPEQSTTSLIMGINTTVFGQNQLGMGAAMALLMGFIMMIITGMQFFVSYMATKKEPVLAKSVTQKKTTSSATDITLKSDAEKERKIT
ncbi:carbohydrate ABC transporter permease [Exiguobacterium indicum]|uniref:carbohydrate ABC transporter permease n=1 Tax=Exiguobacterium indicum TaxID=296995 RepID=UPI00094FC467|nr:sugar ABC transporter permease [Exiguobacterium indicum]